MANRATEIFFEVFERLPRQGPGNRASTERALTACSELRPSPRVLDLGCGGGAQTLDLAALLPGAAIVAVDAHGPLVERLHEAARAAHVDARVDARTADMASLWGSPERFDLIWSEGALYNLGLDTALPLCASLLEPGAYLAFTEAIWLSPDPPPEAREAFVDYPAMGRAEDVVQRIQAHHFTLIDWFVLPVEAWWDDFYSPMERRIEQLRAESAGDAEAQAALDEMAREPDTYRSHGSHYGYGFFVARRS